MFGQQSDYIYTQFTRNEGLPSNECHDVIQDSNGYIWVATDNGVARFDGAKFQRYGLEEGLGDLVIFELREDNYGRIWAGGLKNELYIYHSSTNRFESYKYNYILTTHSLPKGNSIQGFYFDENNDLFVPRSWKGLLSISEKGIANLDSTCINDGYTIFSKAKSEVIMVYDYSTSIPFSYDVPWNIKFYNSEGNCELNKTIIIDKFDSNQSNKYGVKNVDNSVYGFIDNSVFEIKNGKALWTRREADVNRIQKTTKGNIVVSFDNSNGIRLYNNIKENRYTSIVSNISASGFLEDSKGGYWVTSLDKGLIYIKNTKIKHISSAFKKKLYTHLVIDRKNEDIYSASYDGDVEKYNLRTKYSDILLLAESTNFTLLEYDSIKNQVWVSNGTETYIFESYNKITKVVDPFFKNNKNKFGLLDIQFNKDMHFGVGFASKFYKIDPNKYRTLNNGDEEIKSDLVGRLNGSYYQNHSNIILYGHEGLFLYKNGDIIDSVFQDSLLKIRIDKVILNKDKDILCATKGAGLVIKPKDAKPYSINENDGLISNQIEDIIFGEDESIIWVASLNGISKIEFFSDSYEIQNYTTNLGLPVPDVYDMEWFEGKLYAATGKGVIEIEEREVVEFTKPPKLSSFKVNNESVGTADEHSFSHRMNNIFLDYSSINFNMGSERLFRYRINDNNWIATDKSDLYLVNLSPNDYKVEYQVQNEDGFWSPSNTVKFKIKNAWYSTWWFYMLIALLGASSLTYHFLRREKRLKKENDFQEELRNLEKAALQSQMNPHFIFNCLNSIQRFIMDNDKLAAMDYLSRFAKLIRLTLNASVEKEISIYDEVRMLDYYLGLEKLRFKNKFEYEIVVDSTINQYETSLSPLLVQPLVENAIKHGMNTRVDDGVVIVHFDKKDDKVFVTVRDNGKNTKKNKATTNENSGHRSFGMKITGERLGMSDAIKINREDQWTVVTIEI